MDLRIWLGFWSASHREKYAVELASGAQISEKVVDVRAIGNDICAIAEWTVLSKKGYAATFYVREGDDWKIRMDYIIENFYLTVRFRPTEAIW